MDEMFEVLAEEGPVVGEGEMNGCAWQLRAKFDEGYSHYLQTRALNADLRGGGGAGGGRLPEVDPDHSICLSGRGMAGRGRGPKLHDVIGVVSASVGRVVIEAGRERFETALVDLGDGADRLFVGVYTGRDPSAAVAYAQDDSVLERIAIEPFPRHRRLLLRRPPNGGWVPVGRGGWFGGRSRSGG